MVKAVLEDVPGQMYDIQTSLATNGRFEASEAAASSQRVDLGVLREVSRGTTVLRVFAPFWFVNKTQRRLHFRGHDGSGIYVRVKTDNSSQTLVTLSGYKAGQAPILLVNATPTWTVEFGEAGCQASGHPVRPPASEPQRLQPQSLRASEPQSLRG